MSYQVRGSLCWLLHQTKKTQADSEPSIYWTLSRKANDSAIDWKLMARLRTEPNHSGFYPELAQASKDGQGWDREG